MNHISHELKTAFTRNKRLTICLFCIYYSQYICFYLDFCGTARMSSTMYDNEPPRKPKKPEWDKFFGYLVAAAFVTSGIILIRELSSPGEIDNWINTFLGNP